MNCWYQQGCNLYFENCEKTCHRFLEMKYLIENCGMPDADSYIKPLIPENSDLQSYLRLNTIKENIVEFVNNGQNLYIVSEKFGNGKTTWSLKLLYKYFDEIWCGNGFKPRGYFIYVPELLNQLSSFAFKTSEDYKQLHKIITTIDLVIWDDIGCSKLSQNDCTNLSTLLDSRNLKRKSNIYTGNLLSEELREAIGTRLHNRIWDSSEIVKFVGRGRRC